MLDLTSFNKSLKVLENLVTEVSKPNTFANLDQVLQDGVKAGVIQNFEVVYELSWKFIKRYLEHNLGNVYVDGINRKELFRLAYEAGLIVDIDKWFNYHKARNETSHTYDAITADEVFELAKEFVNDARILLDNLEQKND